MFSTLENEIIKRIGKKRVTITDLSRTFITKPHDGVEIFEINNSIAGVIRRVIRKCNHYGLDWTIDGTGRGRAGKTVWITKGVKRGVSKNRVQKRTSSKFA
jgi:hypothetical protein